MGGNKCCSKECDEYKPYKKCITVSFSEASGSGITFSITFRFAAIKNLTSCMMWAGFSSLTLSNFTSATSIVFTGNYSISNCSHFTPKFDYTQFKAPIAYNLSTLTPTTLIQYGTIGFNSSGNITITLTQSSNFANTNVITLFGGATTYAT